MSFPSSPSPSAPSSPADGDAPLLWYVSYGSNASTGRLTCYLQGGRPPGAHVSYPGARDPRPARASIGVILPGRIRFAARSRVWGGSIAFYDHETPGPTPARAHLVTAEQFADIAAQEMHRIPEAGTPLEAAVRAGVPEGRFVAGPGHYETLLNVGQHEELPLLTFTAPGGARHLEPGLPAPAYLAMLTAGLAEGHGWDEQRSRHYLAARGAYGRAA